MKACKFTFVHDFDRYKSLEEQLPAVREKYKRRIERFYKDIAEKTLFIRYINPKEDISWIEENENYILSILRSFNSENKIIYVSNSDVPVKLHDVYYVDKDDKDFVARKFVEKNLQLLSFLESLPFDETTRQKNLAKYKAKQRRKIINSLPDKIKKFWQLLTKKPYQHFQKR